ncbi:MAG TPA: hypothetical protein VG477_14765, partial [Thermoanaerobaculia bacterium]|nr:hypothetical protein [Thermoanaerobaculia bacterium]
MKVPTPLRMGTLLAAGIAVMAGFAQAQNSSDAKAEPVMGEITIEKVAPQKVLYRNLQGGYDKT